MPITEASQGTHASIPKLDTNAPLRSCGPLTLVTALRQFGIELTVDSIWDAVTRTDPFGTRAARTYLLAAMARRSGLDAAVLQCQPPRAWNAIQHCHDAGHSVILNHQAYRAPHEGHYTLLETIDDQQISIDDPFLGSNRRLDRKRFLDLWQPNAETPGHVLIAISRPSYSITTSPQQPFGQCPRCATPLAGAPNGLFEPPNWNPKGLWQRFYCLGCDAAFSASG